MFLLEDEDVKEFYLGIRSEESMKRISEGGRRRNAGAN